MPTPRVPNPISAAGRSARARGAARARHAFAPADMSAAQAALDRKFADAIEAIAPGLPADELQTRARRLRASWNSLIALERGMRRRGRPAREMKLDAWLAERIATAQRKAGSNGTSEPAQEESDDDASSPHSS